MAGQWQTFSDDLVSSPQGRSSHSISHVKHNDKDHLYVIGGENTPRIPLDTTMVHLFDLSSCTWSVVKLSTSVHPRDLLAHTTASIGQNIYLFGGRDAEKEDMGDLWQFNSTLSEWTLVWDPSAQKEGEEAPSRRSYHAMATNGTSLFIFGGCFGKNRLEDAWEYQIATGKWTKLAAGGPGVRGGSSLVYSNNKLYVLFGFNGTELRDVWVLDLQHTEQGWSLLDTSAGDSLGPRSVSAVGSIGSNDIIVFGGECEPSAQGHEGAGRYLQDTAILNLETLKWTKVASDSSSVPSGRGWGASCSMGNGSFVVHGGFGGAERLGDLHIFKLN